MKRYDCKARERREAPDVDKFIAEIIEVCKKHNMSISHEDEHGAFVIEDYNEFRAEWFNEACVDMHY